MQVVVTAQDTGLDALSSPVFGRCPVFVFVDTETMESESLPNPAMAAGGGAGIQAAQFVVDRGVEAVLSHNLGPNASGVLEAAGVRVYQISAGTVREAVEAFVAGKLPALSGPNVGAHSGMQRRP